MRDVGHAHTVGVIVEDVQMQSGDNRVAQRILLIEKTGVRAGLDVVPHAPLADNQPDALARIVAIQNRGMAHDQRVHAPGFLHGAEPLPLGDVGGGSLVLPRAHHRVVMQVNAVDHPAGVLHDRFGPVVIAGIGSGRDAECAVLPHRPQKFREVLVGVCVVLGRHGATTAPAFVAYAPEAHLERLRMPVLRALIRQRAAARMVQVFPPAGHLLHSAAADVSHYECLRAEALHQLHVLVRTEAVVLGDTAPERVDHHRSISAWANAILPMVVIGETAARPAQVRNLNATQRRADVVAQMPLAAAGLAPEAVIDAAAEMLREMTVDVAADGILAEIGVDDELDAVLRGTDSRQEQNERDDQRA